MKTENEPQERCDLCRFPVPQSEHVETVNVYGGTVSACKPCAASSELALAALAYVAALDARRDALEDQGSNASLEEQNATVERCTDVVVKTRDAMKLAAKKVAALKETR